MTSYDRMETCLWCVIIAPLRHTHVQSWGSSRLQAPWWSLVGSSHKIQQSITQALSNQHTQLSKHKESNRSHYHAANAMQQ